MDDIVFQKLDDNLMISYCLTQRQRCFLQFGDIIFSLNEIISMNVLYQERCCKLGIYEVEVESQIGD